MTHDKDLLPAEQEDRTKWPACWLLEQYNGAAIWDGREWGTALSELAVTAWVAFPQSLPQRIGATHGQTLVTVQLKSERDGPNYGTLDFEIRLVGRRRLLTIIAGEETEIAGVLFRVPRALFGGTPDTLKRLPEATTELLPLGTREPGASLGLLAESE